MIEKINHIAIAVNDLESHIPFYRDILHLPFDGIEEVPEQKVRVALFKIGSMHIELLEPLSEDSPISKFLNKNGPGLHHIAFQTDSIQNELKRLSDLNIRLIDPVPREGARQSKIAFIHPASSGGILTELCQSDE